MNKTKKKVNFQFFTHNKAFNNYMLAVAIIYPQQ